ncbi:MAG TPA: uroporphyrinogen-III synthase [Reyranella sp.]|jgi:uroporphyrinogen-III synthase|nr:uroporphyrinogen-III synthase [Reyranella sp.]
MRVLITRPEREATTLATALSQRGHVPVIAPLFRLEILHPPADFAASLAACQAVLLTSANGARALAEASEQRGRPILAVGDTAATTAEGLGFTAVTSAAGDGAALAELVRKRLDPKAGPLVHVSGVDLALDLGAALGRDGFEVRRFALYDARGESTLPDSARAALQARALDAATFFSPRAASQFAKLVGEAGLADSVRSLTAIGISPTALAPLSKLPFKARVAAARPTRQAVLDEIDRLAEAGVQGQAIMSDTPSSPPPAPPPSMAPPVQVRRGLGVFGAFVIGLVAAAIVLAGAVISLPFWPEQARVLWRGQAAIPPAPTPALDLQSVQAAASAVANAAVETARRDLTARLDDLEKRLRALSATAAEKPTGSDPAVAELRGRVEALEGRPAAAPTAAPPSPEADKEMAVLRAEIATLRTALQALDQSVTGQREQTKALGDALGARNASEQKALVAARASAVIGVAARLSAALDSGLPFATDLTLLAPLAQGDAKLTEVAATLQPYAQAGVASRAALAASFPAVAKAALADDVADDSFGQRLLGKVRSIVSLRRVGDDVPGDSAEAKLARAEAALDAGDLVKAVDLVTSLPPQTAKATQAWLARAEAHLAAKRAIDALAAHAISLLGAVR